MDYTLTEKIQTVLEQLAREDIYEMLSFDMKDGEEPGGSSYRELYMNRAETVMKPLGGLSPKRWESMTPWQKLCVYKVSENAGVDCDVALRNVVLYALAYGKLEEGWRIEPQEQNNGRYQLCAPTQAAWVLRGDTMNSYQTTVHEFIRTSEKMDEMLKRGIFYPNPQKPNGPPVSHWEAAFLAQYDYCKTLLPSSAFTFIRQTHTLGNFVPVPFLEKGAGEFNSPRGNPRRAKDYWDLTLVCIYNYYHKKAGRPLIQKDGIPFYTLEWLLSSEENVKLCKAWLKTFGTWENFVGKNFFQDFVWETERGWGKPKELWTGHFEGKTQPQLKQEFHAFFFHTACWIMARGLRIASAAKDYLYGQDLEELARRLAGVEQ